ncbi:MAG: hypothetical protein ACOX3W_03925 [Christensenellaceae bacterium]
MKCQNDKREKGKKAYQAGRARAGSTAQQSERALLSEKARRRQKQRSAEGNDKAQQH